jgi:zinc protease
MFLLEGATRDPRVAAAALSIGRDMSSITPADIQRLARQYLVSDRQWSVAILPKGMTLADAAALDKAAAQGGR